MAGPNAPLPTDQTGNLAANIAALLQTFGGTKTTTTGNAGDTTALQSALGQLQGADYNAMLQSIFQKAGGQIPGLQVALGSAMGSRSGSNSAVAAALQQLLQQTTVGAQEQIAKQQLANQQTQVQAGQAISQATKDTQKTTQAGTNVGKGVSTLAQAAALTQLLGSALKLSGKGTIQEALGGIVNPNTAAASAPPPQMNNPLATMSSAGAPATYATAQAPQMSTAPAGTQTPDAIAQLLQQFSSAAPQTAPAAAPETTLFPEMSVPGGSVISGDIGGDQFSYTEATPVLEPYIIPEAYDTGDYYGY